MDHVFRDDPNYWAGGPYHCGWVMLQKWEKKKQRRKLTLSLHFSFLENILTKIANFKEQKPKDEPKQIQSELHWGHLSSGVNLT